MFKYKANSKKGFTLIELIVTIAVLAILVLLAAPNFLGKTRDAEHAKMMVETKTIENASELYFMDKEDWPRLTDEPYTSDELETFASKFHDKTGKEITLDPAGNYYNIDYDKLSPYAKAPKNKKDYILQNPVGKVFYMENLTEKGENRVDYEETTVNPPEEVIPPEEDIVSEPFNFEYTGEAQEFLVDKTGTYLLEVWGASGGNILSYHIIDGGKGGYSRGKTKLESGSVLYVYVGGKGADREGNHPYTARTFVSGGWNGGGSIMSAGTSTPGGGATDIRSVNKGLLDRLIVAGAGGGSGWTYSKGGAGGGLTGQNGTSMSQLGKGAGGASQNAGGSAGLSASQTPVTPGILGQGGQGSGNSAGGGGGGGGYYGGGGGGYSDGGGGGSGYIKNLIDGETISGNQSMPNPIDGEMIGNTGNGFARITYVGK